MPALYSSCQHRKGSCHAHLQDYPFGLRQLAALLLKQHIKHHWTPEAKHFQPPVVGDDEKAALRRDLVAGLADSEGKMRVAIGMAIAGIAKWDVPTAWPDLLGQLIGAIRERRDGNAVHGAVRCLAMFVDELDDAQVEQVGVGMLLSRDPVHHTCMHVFLDTAQLAQVGGVPS